MAFCAHADTTSKQGQLAPCTAVECEREFVVAHLLQLIDERSHDSGEANRPTGCLDDGCLGAGCSHSPTVRGTHRLCTEARKRARHSLGVWFITSQVAPCDACFTVTRPTGHASPNMTHRSGRHCDDAIRDTVALVGVPRVEDPLADGAERSGDTTAY